MSAECLISLERKKNKSKKKQTKKKPIEWLFQLQIFSVPFSGELSVETLFLHTCIAFLYITKNVQVKQRKVNPWLI